MRISSIAYCIKQGLKNIWRNKMFSLASIATMAACIFLYPAYRWTMRQLENRMHARRLAALHKLGLEEKA